MLGGLHVEMALWNVLGDLLDGSGWITALSEAEVGSSGVADSFLKAAHLTRTRYVVQSLKIKFRFKCWIHILLYTLYFTIHCAHFQARSSGHCSGPSKTKERGVFSAW